MYIGVSYQWRIVLPVRRQTSILRSRRQSRRVKNEKNLPCLSRVKNYHQLVVTCRASFRTPWNAASRTTVQDALWRHIVNRNTRSKPVMTPCARQVMNGIPGDLTPSWAGCWGPPHLCSMSRAIYLPAQRNQQPAMPIFQTEAPIAPKQGNPGCIFTNCTTSCFMHNAWVCGSPVIAYRMEIEDSYGQHIRIITEIDVNWISGK